MTALAATAMFSAAPALASNLPLNQQTGPDLNTKIFASGDAGWATVGTTVYGNTSNGAGHNVTYTGYQSFNGTTFGALTTIDITGGNGFAQIADHDSITLEALRRTLPQIEVISLPPDSFDTE